MLHVALTLDGAPATARTVGRWVVVQTNNGAMSCAREFDTAAEAVAFYAQLAESGPIAGVSSSWLTGQGFAVGARSK